MFSTYVFYLARNFKKLIESIIRLSDDALVGFGYVMFNPYDIFKLEGFSNVRG